MIDYTRAFRLDGRVALVVGAGSGIGAAAAGALAAVGARVACWDINTKTVAEVARTIRDTKGHAEARGIDVLDAPTISASLSELVEREGRLDVLVTTPAVNVRKPILSYTDEEFERVINLNLKGTFHVLREGGRVMAAQRGGSLIALSSIRSLVVEPGQGVYAATKAGIVQLIKTLAAELGPLGVRANAIAPGVIDTPLTQPIQQNPTWFQAYANKTALGRWGRSDEVATSVVFLASDASSYITGTVLFVDGGWTAIDGRFSPPV